MAMYKHEMRYGEGHQRCDDVISFPRNLPLFSLLYAESLLHIEIHAGYSSTRRSASVAAFSRLNELEHTTIVVCNTNVVLKKGGYKKKSALFYSTSNFARGNIAWLDGALLVTVETKWVPCLLSLSYGAILVRFGKKAYSHRKHSEDTSRFRRRLRNGRRKYWIPAILLAKVLSGCVYVSCC